MSRETLQRRPILTGSASPRIRRQLDSVVAEADALRDAVYKALSALSGEQREDFRKKLFYDLGEAGFNVRAWLLMLGVSAVTIDELTAPEIASLIRYLRWNEPRAMRAVGATLKELLAAPVLDAAGNGKRPELGQRARWQDRRDQTDRIRKRASKKALLGIILILFFCVGAASALPQNLSKTQKVSQTQHLDRASELMASGDFAGAIDQYRKAIEVAETDPAVIHNELGIALAESGQIDAAIGEFRTALRQKAGEFALAHYNLALALMEKGDLGGAEPELKVGIAQTKEKSFPQGHNTLGFLYAQIGKPAAAAAEFHQAIDESGGVYSQAHYNLGILLYDQGRVAESVAEFRFAVEQSKNFPDAHYNLGVALADLGKNAEAAQAFEAYLAQSEDPEDLEQVRQRISQLRGHSDKP